MDATTPSTPDDELDLDVRFVESGLEVAGGDSADCDDDDTGHWSTTACLIPRSNLHGVMCSGGSSRRPHNFVASAAYRVHRHVA